MNITKSRRNGLGMIALLILIAAILVIAGTIVYMLIQLCRRAFQKHDEGTGLWEQVTPENVANYADGFIQLPQLSFPELAAPEGKTEERPFGASWMEIERSTNLVDWETILVITNPAYTFLLEDDTNPPPDKAFYRGKFVYP